uniref:Uncharacterized protein n=1 Tax=Oryza meridionalis TaxID=40149 RepID=A0A0E0DQ39_9ORYZ
MAQRQGGCGGSGAYAGAMARRLGGNGGAGADATGAGPEARRKGVVAEQRELAVVGRLPHCGWAPSPLEVLLFFTGSFLVELKRQLVNGGSSSC